MKKYFANIASIHSPGAGDRAHGADHPQEVQLHPDAAQAVHLRGRHDPALAVSSNILININLFVYPKLYQKRNKHNTDDDDE